MKFLKNTALFCAGGGAYCTLELLWRGWTHGTMFILGGGCFLLLGRLGRVKVPLLWRLLAGTMVCTAGELLFGMLFNRSYQIWDYRRMPLNLGGQICAAFSVLWVVLSGAAMWLYDKCDRSLTKFLG